MDKKYIVLFSNCNILEGIILYAGDGFQAAGKAAETSYLHGEDIVSVIKVDDEELSNDAADNADNTTTNEDKAVFMIFEDSISIKYYNVDDIKKLSINILNNNECYHFIGSLNGRLPEIKIMTKVESWTETITFHYYEVEKRK